MALDSKWLNAQWNLAWKLVGHYLRKLWPWSPRYGLVRFQENYVVEGLPPATPAFRELAHHPGRCTTCGACDAVCPLLLSERSFAGPMSFVVSGARAAPHLKDVAESLAFLTSPTCAECGKCEAACPEGIPILALAAGLSAQAKVIEQAQKGTLPILPSDVPRVLAERRQKKLAAPRPRVTSKAEPGPVTSPEPH